MAPTWAGAGLFFKILRWLVACKPASGHVGSTFPQIVTHVVDEHGVESLESLASPHHVGDALDGGSPEQHSLGSHDGATSPVTAANVVPTYSSSGRLYSRTVIIQNTLIAEPNRILNCDWSLRSTVNFDR